MTGIIPYSCYDYVVPLSDMETKEGPKRPSDGTTDPIWQLLLECWIKYHGERPSTTQVYNTLSKFRTVEELPEKMELRVQSIKISFTGTRRDWFYVKFVYGSEVHITLPTTRVAAGNECVWFVLRPSLPPLLSLNLGQGLSRTLVDTNQ